MAEPVAPKKPAPIVAIKDYVMARSHNLAAALKGTGVDIDRFLILALNQTLQTPLLLQCTPASWFDAMQKAATHGLLPDGIHAALVPYKFTDKNAKPIVSEYRVQFMPMFQGLVQRAYQTEIVSKIWARVVYQDDEFDVEEGDTPRITHRPAQNGDRNDDRLVAAYACAKIGQEVVFAVLYPRDIKRHEAASKTADSSSSPWQTAKAEMWKKTAIISLSKTLPHYNAKGMKYAQLVSESEREDLALPAPIEVSFLPEAQAPSGLNPLKEQLRAQAEEKRGEPSKVEQMAQAIGAQPNEEQIAAETRAAAKTHDPDAPDAEKEPPPPCEHKGLWRLAKNADPNNKLVCVDCDRDVPVSEIQMLSAAAK